MIIAFIYLFRDASEKWRRLHNEELHSPYRSPNIVRLRLRWTSHLARMEDSRSAFKVLIVKPIGKRFLRRSRHRWEDNIRINFREIGINVSR